MSAIDSVGTNPPDPIASDTTATKEPTAAPADETPEQNTETVKAGYSSKTKLPEQTYSDYKSEMTEPQLKALDDAAKNGVELPGTAGPNNDKKNDVYVAADGDKPAVHLTWDANILREDGSKGARQVESVIVHQDDGCVTRYGLSDTGYEAVNDGHMNTAELAKGLKEGKYCDYVDTVEDDYEPPSGAKKDDKSCKSGDAKKDTSCDATDAGKAKESSSKPADAGKNAGTTGDAAQTDKAKGNEQPFASAKEDKPAATAPAPKDATGGGTGTTPKSTDTQQGKPADPAAKSQAPTGSAPASGTSTAAGNASAGGPTAAPAASPNADFAKTHAEIAKCDTSKVNRDEAYTNLRDEIKARGKPMTEADMQQKFKDAKGGNERAKWGYLYKDYGNAVQGTPGAGNEVTAAKAEERQKQVNEQAFNAVTSFSSDLADKANQNGQPTQTNAPKFDAAKTHEEIMKYDTSKVDGIAAYDNFKNKLAARGNGMKATDIEKEFNEAKSDEERAKWAYLYKDYGRAAQGGNDVTKDKAEQRQNELKEQASPPAQSKASMPLQSYMF